jgi:hypothetical protein
VAAGLAYLLMGLSGVAGAATLFLSQQGGTSRPCPKCKKEMMADWQSCLFCGTNPELESGRPGALHFVTGPFSDQVVVLEKPVTTIGSVPGNDLVIPDTSVSRKHAGIRRVEGGYEVADFGSTNGIYVNGERTPKKKLTVGDVIRVGNIEMVFRV